MIGSMLCVTGVCVVCDVCGGDSVCVLCVMCVGVRCYRWVSHDSSL